MFNIESVEVAGFWGRFKAAVRFNNDVTIFIGRNGTGKTTFINLLEAALRADMNTLAAIEFDQITLKLKDKKRVRTVTVSKAQGNEQGQLFSRFPYISFKIGKNTFRIPILPTEYQRHFRSTAPYVTDYENLKQTLDELINIASLSVHRTDQERTSELIERTERIERSRVAISPIDVRLQSLIDLFHKYNESKKCVISSEAEKSLSALRQDFSASFVPHFGRNDTLTGIMKEV